MVWFRLCRGLRPRGGVVGGRDAREVNLGKTRRSTEVRERFMAHVVTYVTFFLEPPRLSHNIIAPQFSDPPFPDVGCMSIRIPSLLMLGHIPSWCSIVHLLSLHPSPF